MASHRYAVAGAICSALILGGVACGLPAAAGTGPAGHHRGRCSAGAHTLSAPGSHVYPETGNGGYISLHTDVHLVYDAASNRFLPGNHVRLTDRATRCLTSFSLDFERRSANASAGPDMAVTSVTVNGRPAAFAFVQPTYPGDPNGQDDPDPLAHEASQLNPVGGPGHNPLPPACSPELPSTSAKPNSKNGTQCRANKLVIAPSRPDITRFESMFTGPFPFTSDGVVVGRPSAGFEEEMQTMITFAAWPGPGSTREAAAGERPHPPGPRLPRGERR